MNRLIQILLLGLLCFGIFKACDMRLYNLENRALHADESEQSFTFAGLYFNGDYKYNANGPHGPVLYYYPLKLVDKSFADTLDTRLLRRTLLPIFLATCALVFFAMLARANYDARELLLKANPALGRLAGGVFAAIFLGLSSLSQIYSSYFIQEPFFALFSLALCFATFAFIKRPSLPAALIVGLCAGLLQSAKETSIIVFAALVGAWILSLLNLRNPAPQIKAIFSKKSLSFALAALAGFALIYCLFYSSFFANPAGILDGVKSYAHFFGKSVSEVHTKGFGYYFELLAGLRSQGAIFGESAIFILAIVGTILAYLRKNDFIKFTAVFGWLNVLALSFIGYKTPWLLLAPITALALPTGYAVSAAVFSHIDLKNKILAATLKVGLLIFVLALFNLQYKEAKNASRNYASDPRNPFLYVHTLKSEEGLVKRIYDCAKVKGDKFKAICISNNSPWPLPWQTLKLDAVTYAKALPQNFNPGDFDIVIFDANFDSPLSSAFPEEEWISEFFGLRENLLLRVQVKRELFYESIQ